jgi:hypothetical protein
MALDAFLFSGGSKRHDRLDEKLFKPVCLTYLQVNFVSSI